MLWSMHTSGANVSCSVDFICVGVGFYRPLAFNGWYVGIAIKTVTLLIIF